MRARKLAKWAPPERKSIDRISEVSDGDACRTIHVRSPGRIVETSLLMLERKKISIESIYVPAKRFKTLDENKVLALAEDILVNGQKTPVRLRPDGDRYVLIEGLHRLEALRALGETFIVGFLVGARLH